MSSNPPPGNAKPPSIQFYGVGDEYGELSNFALYPITLKGKRWPTSEHYFQAQKFVATRDQEEIRSANTPMLAARWGRDRKRKLRRDWESVKVGVMREAVEAKFLQHDELRALLLATGDATLVEHTENDEFWGDGGDGSGRNELGRILMAVRERLRRSR
jgi:N-glycosidase YbiA